MSSRLSPVRTLALALAASAAALVGGGALPAPALAANAAGFTFTLVDGSAVECEWKRGALRCLDLGAAGSGSAPTCKTGTRVSGKQIGSRKRPKSISVCATAGTRDLRTLQPGKSWRRGSVKCRVAKDATTFSCRNKTGPFVLFRAEDDGPIVAPTTQCPDVPLSPGTATKVSATDVDCAGAGTLIVAVAAAHDAVNGPRTFRSGDWACAVVTDGTPAVGHYNCARGDAIVTWDDVLA